MHGQGTIYACKPCFGKLEMGEKQRQALERTVDEILTLAASASFPRIDSEIDAGTCTQTASVAIQTWMQLFQDALIASYLKR